MVNFLIFILTLFGLAKADDNIPKFKDIANDPKEIIHNHFKIPPFLYEKTKFWYDIYSKYNNKSFTAAVKKNNILGFQFHPEKSGTVGLDLLKDTIKNKIN